MQGFTEYPELVPHLRAIKEALGLDSPRILYPCSGADITPCYVWGSRKIVFLDNDPARIALLKNLDLDARIADVTAIGRFAEFDVIYAHNSPAKIQNCMNLLAKNGHVIGNGMYNLKKLIGEKARLIGITEDDGRNARFNSNTAGIYEEINTFEGFQSAALAPELGMAIESIVNESRITERAIFEILQNSKFPIYKRYGKLYVFQKI